MAITGAALQSYSRVGSSYRVVFRLTDSTKAGGTYDVTLTVNGASVPELANDASRQIADMIKADAQGDLLASIPIGTTIPITYTPPGQAALTDDQIWVNNARLVMRATELKNAGLDGAFLTDLAGLVATVKTGYSSARALML